MARDELSPSPALMIVINVYRITHFGLCGHGEFIK